MMRYLFSLLLALISTCPIYAQEEVPTPQVQKQLEMTVAGHQPPTSNILFIVDTSGSMDQQQVADAIQAVLNIAEVPLDDLQIALISFGGVARRWAGTEDRNPQTGELISRPNWSLMPSRHNLDAAREWLENSRDGGGTQIIAAINQAFASCGAGEGGQSVRNLSIIIISDGDFNNFGGLQRSIDERQRERRRADLDDVAIGFFGIGVTERDDQSIRNLVGENATRCILGYMRLRYVKPGSNE